MPPFENNNIPYRIEALPNDERIWRVMWHGKVRRTNETREGELGISVTPLRSRYKPNDINFSNNLIDYFDYESSKIVHVGIGQINLFRIGSFWQHQACLGSLPYRVKQAYFTINIANLKYRKVGDRTFPYTNYSEPNKKKLSHCISKYDYFIDPALKATWIAVAKDSFGAEYIIPTSEIARFYYMTSSKMALAMTEGWQFNNPNDIWNSDRSGIVDDDTYHIHLRKNFGIAEASVIARMDACPIARRQGNLIVQNLNQFGFGKNNNSAGELKCGFPFEDSTRLTLRGLPTKMGQVSRFLVYEIISCSGRFPFDRLTVDNDISTHFENKGDPNRPIAPHIPQIGKFSNSEADKVIKKVDTSFLNPAERFEQEENKFLDRKNKVTEYFYRDKPQTKRAPSDQPLNNGNTLSTAHPGYSAQEAGQLNIISSTDSDSETEQDKTRRRSINLPVKFAATLKAVILVCEVLDLTYQMIGIGNTVEIQVDGGSVLGCYYPENRFKRRRWELLYQNTANEKLRRALVLRITDHYKYHYLFEAEREEVVSSMNDKSSGPSLLIISVDMELPIDNQTLSLILQAQVENKTTWLKSNQFPDLKRARISHSCGSEKTFADAIIRKMRS